MALPTILLVDDTKLFLTMEKEMLSRSAVMILTATTGREALELAQQQHPDLIFMDLSMPEMDGISCCAAIKTDPMLKSTPVVMVSTSDNREVRTRCTAAGCNGYLVKPFTRVEFLNMGQKFIPDIERRENRIPWIAPAFITFKGETRTASSVDLSMNGIFIASEHRIERDDPLDVTFTIDASRSEWIEVWGRVSWINPGHAPVKPNLPEGFGIQFLAMSDSDRERLTLFLRSQES